MTPQSADEKAFNSRRDDYVTGQVAEVPEIVSAMRYRSPAGPHYLSVYELSTLDVPGALRGADDAAGGPVSGVTRYVGEEVFVSAREDGAGSALDAPVLWCVFLSVPLEAVDGFAQWFDTEYAPQLLADPGWLMVRRFETVEFDPEPYTQIVLNYLDNDSVRGGAVHALAEETDGFRRIASERWFKPHGVVYHRYGKRILKRQ